MLQVVLILEILIRKCGFDAVNLVTPEKYKEFVRSVEEVRIPSLIFSDLAVE
jgi:ribosomal RNA-processing protein 12